MYMDHTTRPRTVRLSLDATATRPPGRGRAWTVEAGHWRGDGNTERAASDALAAGLQAFLMVYRPPLTLTFGGYHATVWAEPGGGDNPVVWCTRTVKPKGHYAESWSSVGSWEEAEADARHQLAQLATDWHDDASVHDGAAYLEGCDRFGYGQRGPAEFYRHAAWQRAARAALDAGRGDWHEWASANANQFTITPRKGADDGR